MVMRASSRARDASTPERGAPDRVRGMALRHLPPLPCSRSSTGSRAARGRISP